MGTSSGCTCSDYFPSMCGYYDDDDIERHVLYVRRRAHGLGDEAGDGDGDGDGGDYQCNMDSWNDISFNNLGETVRAVTAGARDMLLPDVHELLQRARTTASAFEDDNDSYTPASEQTCSFNFATGTGRAVHVRLRLHGFGLLLVP